MQKVAIFDLDGTIFRSSLLVEVTEGLIEAGIFKKSARAYYEKHYLSWMDRKGTYEKYIMGVVEAFEKNIKGVDQVVFMRVAKKVIASKKDRTYRYTRDLVRKLNKKGYFLLAISHSPKMLVDTFCRELGFDASYGRIYEVGKNGKFTGKVDHVEIINDKGKALASAIEKYELSLEGSIAVGDTEADVSLFKMVDSPICFNPNRALFAAAKRRGWKVVVERKDMLYEIQQSKRGLFEHLIKFSLF